MASLYITEYIDIDGTRQVGTEPPIVEQKLTIGTHVESAPFNPQTTLIRLHADAICSVLVSNAGTAATTANGRMAANQTEYRGVKGGQILSVVTNS